MKTVLTGEFTRHFAALCAQPVKVRNRDKILGTWVPEAPTPPPIDYLKRAQTIFKRPLPFTGAQLLKEGKKR